MTDISWLHLSDLHCGSGRFRDHWSNVYDSFRADLKNHLDQIGTLDLVLFTGDLTEGGEESQFNALNEVLEVFWSDLRKWSQTPCFFAIPGNHDLTRREKDKDPALLTLTELWEDPRVGDYFWSDGRCTQRKLVEKVFKNYVQWWKDVPVPKLTDSKSGLLPGDLSATFEKDGVKLGLLGINTAFLQLVGGDRKGRLDVSVKQFSEACGGDGPRWARNHDISFVLTHHPLEWLCPRGHSTFIDDICAGPTRFAVHLFGHMHDPKLRIFSEGGGDTRVSIQAYSLFSMKPWSEEKRGERRFGYSLGQIRASGTDWKLRLCPRKAERKEGGGWSFSQDPKIDYEPGSNWIQWFTLPRRTRSDVLAKHAATPLHELASIYSKAAALAGPVSYTEAHDRLRDWIRKQSKQRSTPIKVLNIALDMEKTWAFLKDEILGRTWGSLVEWQSLMIDHEAAALQKLFEKDSEISTGMAEERELQIKQYEKDYGSTLRERNVIFKCRTYKVAPFMHGFFISHEVLMAAFCLPWENTLKTSPYFIFFKNPDGYTNLDGDIATQVIEMFSAWFDRHWLSGRWICGESSGSEEKGPGSI